MTSVHERSGKSHGGPWGRQHCACPHAHVARAHINMHDYVNTCWNPFTTPHSCWPPKTHSSPLLPPSACTHRVGEEWVLAEVEVQLEAPWRAILCKQALALHGKAGGTGAWEQGGGRPGSTSSRHMLLGWPCAHACCSRQQHVPAWYHYLWPGPNSRCLHLLVQWLPIAPFNLQADSAGRLPAVKPTTCRPAHDPHVWTGLLPAHKTCPSPPTRCQSPAQIHTSRADCQPGR